MMIKSLAYLIALLLVMYL